MAYLSSILPTARVSVIAFAAFTMMHKPVKPIGTAHACQQCVVENPNVNHVGTCIDASNGPGFTWCEPAEQGCEFSATQCGPND